MERDSELLRLLADLLDYPGSELPGNAARCRMLLAELHPEAAGQMDSFVAYLDGELLGSQEEVYSSTFDLKPECYPYAGHLLFGEMDPKRSELMVMLRESYRAEGFEAGNELPDHVPVLLRFLAHTADEELRRDLAEWVLAPALEKMAHTLEEKHNPYGQAVAAAFRVMSDEL
jgi:nitrate reductase molybdenum cofactor assembly chaperone NarJ/NarW